MMPFEKGHVDHPITKDQDIWVNDVYQVNIKHDLPDGWLWLSIKRKDKQAIHDWRELQAIKNLLCGEEREAVEIYPAESRLVDTSNQFHLFVMPEGQKFPFGYSDRLVVRGHEGGWFNGSAQRDFTPEETPKDAISNEEAEKRVADYIKKVAQ